jgi:hypothetical protein
MKRLFWILFAVFLIALLRTAILAPADGTDFQVYWNAARHFRAGEKVYSFSRDALRCFKYPPWILPWFLPFGFLSLETAAIVFRALEVAAIAGLGLELRRYLREPLWAIVALLSFWGFWMYNTQTGQISAFLVLGAVAGLTALDRTWGGALLFSALSAKIVQLYSLIGLPKPRHLLKTAGIAAGVCVVLSLPSLLQYGWHWGQWLADFREACTSVGPNLSASNQGIAAFWISLLGLPRDQIASHYFVAAASAVVLAAIVFVFRKNLSAIERFAVLLAYGGILHPLAFSYNLVWACPMAALALDRVFASRRRGLQIGVWVALLEMVAVSEKTVGFLVFPGYRAVAVVAMSWLMMVGKE